MSRPPHSLCSLLLCLCSSCASAPDVVHPRLDVEPPESWGDAAGATGRSQPWWMGFEDGRLNAVVVEVIERNHDLEAASARVFAAASRAVIAGADVLPGIDGAFDASRSKQNFIGFPIPGAGGNVLSTRFTRLGVALNLDWELDVWGRIRAGHSAALADIQAAKADYHAARVSLIGQTVKLWFGLLETRRQLELAQATLQNLRSTHEKIVSRYERGLRPSLDIRFSLTNISTANAVVAARLEQLDRLTRQIEVLLGRYPGGSLAITSDLPALPAEVPSGLPSELVYRRPDVAAAERRLAAAGARVKEARRALFPRFSLTGSGGTSSNELEDIVDLDLSVWTLAGNVAQPVFQGGRLLAGIDLAESREREALATYAGEALDAFREVEEALAAEALLKQQVEALRMATEQSVAARQLAENRYDRGLDDLITVLEAQRRAFNSESELLFVERQILENRVDLHLALGGDFGDLHVENPDTESR